MFKEGAASLNNTIFAANELLKNGLKQMCNDSTDPNCLMKIDVANELMVVSKMSFYGYLSLFCGTTVRHHKELHSNRSTALPCIEKSEQCGLKVKKEKKTEIEPEQEFVVDEMDGKICFSWDPVPKCPKGTHNGKMIWKKTKFSCVPATARAREIAEAVRRGETVKTF